MTTLGFAGLTAAYVFVVALLLSINLYSRWPWPVKAGTILLATAFYAVSYLSIPPLLGWPVTGDLPAEFRLVAAQVREPDKITQDPGAIYLWVMDAGRLADDSAPRAFRLPYSAPTHDVVINATARLGKGVAQMGEFRKAVDPDARMLDEPARTGQTSAPVTFYDVPDPLYPEK
ncbi:MAG: hypothetical protein HYY36_08110 [Gammaproteobacteria bacterium]|nr:hypothetical protein [Gammaproteobacteria bacterium]